MWTNFTKLIYKSTSIFFKAKEYYCSRNELKLVNWHLLTNLFYYYMSLVYVVNIFTCSSRWYMINVLLRESPDQGLITGLMFWSDDLYHLPDLRIRSMVGASRLPWRPCIPSNVMAASNYNTSLIVN